MSISLPEPGGDTGTWGDELNAFLRVEHNEDGSLKNAAPLAASGQTPAQEPVSEGLQARVGSLPIAARADHTHPVVFLTMVADIGMNWESGHMISTTLTLTEGREYATLVSFGYTMSFDRIGVGIPNLGSTGSVVRLGVRAFQGSAPGTPGAIVLDAGTMASGPGASGNPIDISGTPLIMTKPGLAWLTVTAQGGATSPPTVAGVQYPPIRVPGTLGSNGLGSVGPYQSSVSGALSDPWTRAGDYYAPAPWFCLRRSA